jgi:hypothetical protein
VTNAELVKLVMQVNAGLALATWPFAIYEVFSKGAPVSTLKLNLDIRRGQLLKLVTDQIEQEILPFWPKPSVIHVESDYRIAGFSNDLKSAVTTCLERSERILSRAARAKTLASVILRLDDITYWLVYATAAQSLLCLLAWFFWASSMSDLIARIAIVSPVATASLALVSAGIRQVYHRRAQREIVDELTNS